MKTILLAESFIENKKYIAQSRYPSVSKKYLYPSNGTYVTRDGGQPQHPTTEWRTIHSDDRNNIQ